MTALVQRLSAGDVLHHEAAREITRLTGELHEFNKLCRALREISGAVDIKPEPQETLSAFADRVRARISRNDRMWRELHGLAAQQIRGRDLTKGQADRATFLMTMLGIDAGKRS